MKILLSLSSRKLRNGKRNPKTYPYGEELIKLLHKEGIYTIQVRIEENDILSAKEVRTNVSMEDLETLIKECDTFISVDNFIQHYASYLGKKGIVIWSKSDPDIFGYPQNINLLKSKKYLRKNQFDTWEMDQFVKEAFVSPKAVIGRVLSNWANTLQIAPHE